MKLVLMTTMYQRHNLTDYVFSYYKKLKNEIKDSVELVLLVGGSEGEVSQNIAEKNSFNYIEVPNFPLSNKHNVILKECKKYDPDGVILIGSDDLISKETILHYIKCVNDGIDYTGFKDFNLYDGTLYYWEGYTNERSGEPIGAGRFYSKNLLDKLDWDLWGEKDLNKGLDLLATKKMNRVPYTKEIITTLSIGGMIVDIKTEQNITNIKSYSNLKKVNKYALTILGIDINELDKTIKNKSDHNFAYMDLSILIATYKNSQYLDECFNSIYESIGNYNVEVLVGIDSCMESYDFIKKNSYPPNFSFYFFEKNNGPYVVFNSLSKIARSENIMFFGSDDIMDKNMVSDMINGLNKFDCIKPTYVNFNDGQEINIKSKKLRGEGVFGIKKSSFNYMNGFEPWMCAADSDFMGRIYKTKNRINYTNNINFYRRIHENGLTSRTDTGMGSPLRAHYVKLSMNKKVAGPLEIMVTEPFVYIDGGPYIPQTRPNDVFRKKTENPINRLFEGRGVEIENQVKEINYDKINDIVGKRELKKVPDKVKTENKNSNLNSTKNLFIVNKIIKSQKNRPNRGDGSIMI